MPTANRKAPIGGADELVRQHERALHPGVGDAEVLAGHEPGRSVLLAESAKVSAVPRTNSATRTIAMLTVPLTIVATRTTSTSGPAEVDHDDHPPAVEAVRRGAADDAEQQDRQVLAQDRHRDEERIARLGRDEQRAGGERRRRRRRC